MAQEDLGIQSNGFFIGGGLKRVVDRLREPVLPTLKTVVDTLGAHLNSRIEDLLSDLDFIVDGSRPASREEAARVAQLFAALEQGGMLVGSTDPETYVGHWTLESVHNTAQSIGSLVEALDRIDAFSRFADIEKEIEVYEKDVSPLVTIVDQMVDEEIDRLRGK